MTLYSIRDWGKSFENNRTRELKKLDWVPIPNKQDGDGYTELLDLSDGVSIFGTWIILIQIASKCVPRGTLIRDSGEPHTSHSLARMSRVPAGLITRSLEILVVLRWVESVPYENPAGGCGNPAGGCLEGKGREGTEGKGREGSPSFSEIPSWEEFFAYCQIHGGPVEWYAKDKFLAAEQDNWRGKAKWTAYADRVRGWWVEAGRPMVAVGVNGQKKSKSRDIAV